MVVVSIRRLFVLVIVFMLVFSSVVVFAVKPPGKSPPGKDKPDNPNKGKGKDKDGDSPPDDNGSGGVVSWVLRSFGMSASIDVSVYGVWSDWSPWWVVSRYNNYSFLSMGVNDFWYPVLFSIDVMSIVVSVDGVYYSWVDAVGRGFVDSWVYECSDAPHFPEPVEVLNPGLCYSVEVFVDCVFEYGDLN